AGGGCGGDLRYGSAARVAPGGRAVRRRREPHTGGGRARPGRGGAGSGGCALGDGAAGGPAGSGGVVRHAQGAAGITFRPAGIRLPAITDGGTALRGRSAPCRDGFRLRRGSAVRGPGTGSGLQGIAGCCRAAPARREPAGPAQAPGQRWVMEWRVGCVRPDQARPAYSPVPVLTRMRSPTAMYSGTMISRPVETFAGLGRLVAVPPLSSGAVSTTSSPTLGGSCRPTGSPSISCT